MIPWNLSLPLFSRLQTIVLSRMAFAIVEDVHSLDHST